MEKKERGYRVIKCCKIMFKNFLNFFVLFQTFKENDLSTWKHYANKEFTAYLVIVIETVDHEYVNVK